jgi:hypothetical protein
MYRSFIKDIYVYKCICWYYVHKQFEVLVDFSVLSKIGKSVSEVCKCLDISECGEKTQNLSLYFIPKVSVFTQNQVPRLN